MLENPGKNLNPRFSVWRVNVSEIMASPIIGTGFGLETPAKKYKEHRLPLLGRMSHESAHNVLLNNALQLGVPGLLAFSLIMSKLCLIGLRCCRKFPLQTSQRFLMSALFIMTIGCLSRNMFDDFFIDDLALLFWFLAGVCVSIAVRKQEATVSNR